MSGLAKTFTFLILVFSLAFAAVSATLYGVRRDWRGRAHDAEAQVTSLQDQMKKETTRLEGERDKLERSKNKATAELASTKGQLLSAQKANDNLGKQVTALTTSNKVLAESLKVAQQLAQRYENDVRRLNGEAKKAQAAIDKQADLVRARQGDIEKLKSERTDLTNDLTKTKDTLTAQAKELKQKTDIMEDAAKRGIALVVGTSGPIKGQVVKASGPIVVINRGKEHGVMIGSEFTVYSTDPSRGFVGKMRVESVRPTMSYGTPITSLTKKQILAGDYVTNTIR